MYIGGHFSTLAGVAATNVAQWTNPGWSGLRGGLGDLLVTLTAGPNGTLYAGGYFSWAGGKTIQNIAHWDGTNWSALGEGISGGYQPGVNAIAVAEDGRVYVGGKFTTAGAVPASSVAVWDGTNWSGLGDGVSWSGLSGSGLVQAIAVNGNKVYVGGKFDRAGSASANCVACWDGKQWRDIRGF